MRESLSKVKQKVAGFVREGCRSLMQDGPLVPEEFLISSCPVTTGLALLFLQFKNRLYKRHIASGIEFLKKIRNPDGGWSLTISRKSDKTATEVCEAAINFHDIGISSEAILTVTSSLSCRWLREIPRLLPGWSHDSSFLKITEYFLTGERPKNYSADISFENYAVVLRLIPPSIRPMVLALACIKEGAKNKKSGKLLQAVKTLISYQSPHGTWGEDVFQTCLCIICLTLTNRFPGNQQRGLKWLASIQYESVNWPAFNQFSNRLVGLALSCMKKDLTGDDFFIEGAQYLGNRTCQDGSFGALSPYSLPDLHSTALALWGLCAASPLANDLSKKIAQTVHLLLSLQNRDGSWGIFPELSDAPPYCTCNPPAHLKSTEVAIYIVQSLLKAGVNINYSQIQRALWWLAYQQKPDGSWNSAWYSGNTYSTSLALSLFSTYNLWPGICRRARTWLLKAQNDDGSWPLGSAGECGLALSALLLSGEAPNSEVITKGLSYITSLQQPQGAFTPAYGFRSPNGLNYDDPITEALHALTAIELYFTKSSN